MKKLIIYVHGKGGTAAEAEHYKPFFPDDDVIGLEYHSQNPWDAIDEFSDFYDSNCDGYDSVILIANSIGAFFSMNAFDEKKISQALFISPIVNMEKLIANLMFYANVTEEELCERKEISTNFGETLSWQYLCYVREHPVKWCVPTCILYGDKDDLTSEKTINAFVKETGATLTVMKGGEHWFHTEEQMNFLDGWLKQSLLQIPF